MRYLYETHMHTSESSKCATSTAIEQVRAYKKMGYAGIIVTDHFINGYTNCPPSLSWEQKMRHCVKGYEAAKLEGDKCDLDVFLGFEYCTAKGHEFLTYGLDLEFLIKHKDIDKMELEDYCTLVRKNGGYTAWAHPYRNRPWSPKDRPKVPFCLDGVEVFNSSESDANNKMAEVFAKKNKLVRQAGSDSHNAGYRISFAGIQLENRAKSIFDIIDALKTEKATLFFPL